MELLQSYYHIRVDLIENEKVGKWMLLINAWEKTSSPEVFMTECCVDEADGQRGQGSV